RSRIVQAAKGCHIVGTVEVKLPGRHVGQQSADVHHVSAENRVSGYGSGVGDSTYDRQRAAVVHIHSSSIVQAAKGCHIGGPAGLTVESKLSAHLVGEAAGDAQRISAVAVEARNEGPEVVNSATRQRAAVLHLRYSIIDQGAKGCGAPCRTGIYGTVENESPDRLVGQGAGNVQRPSSDEACVKQTEVVGIAVDLDRASILCTHKIPRIDQSVHGCHVAGPEEDEIPTPLVVQGAGDVYH